MANLKEIARKSTGRSECEVGTKLNTKDILSMPLTLRNFSFTEFTNPKTGELIEYAACNFDEFPNAHYCAGTQLTSLCHDIYDGGANDEMKETGLKIQLDETKTAAGNNFIAVTVL